MNYQTGSGPEAFQLTFVPRGFDTAGAVREPRPQIERNDCPWSPPRHGA